MNKWLHQFQVICVNPRGEYVPPPAPDKEDDVDQSKRRRAICGNAVGTSFDAKHWLALNPCGLGGVMSSSFILLFCAYTVTHTLLEGNRTNVLIYFAFYLPSTLLALVSLWRTAMTNPGAVPLGARPLQEHINIAQFCPKCNNNYKPPRAHHDSVTGRCVVKFDHFCPWVNAAVGALNQKFFCLFCLHTALACASGMIMIFNHAWQCGFYIATECTDLWTNVFLVVTGIIFIIFTATMLYEQLPAIRTGKGKVARMKERKEISKEEMGGQEAKDLFRPVTNDFNEMFGGHSTTPAWHWFLPLTITFPPGMKRKVLGFDYEDSYSPKPYQKEAGQREPYDLERNNLLASGVRQRKSSS